MAVQLSIRPIDQWPGQRSKFQRGSKFRSNYSKTIDQLTRELEKINAASGFVCLDIEPSQLTLDGRLRANTYPRSSAVILVVEKRDKTTLRFPCDKYSHWHENLRAIALSLEALRAVDRYGVTRSGEQYKGWDALPSPAGHAMSREEAERVAKQMAGLDPDNSTILGAAWEYVIREAERKTHPDAGGLATDFKKVQDARRVILGK